MELWQKLGMDKEEFQRLYDQMIRRLNNLVALSGGTASALSKKAGLHHDAIGRKLSGRDKSLLKEAAYIAIEDAAKAMAGTAGISNSALGAEMEELDREIADAIDDLVKALLDAGVLKREQLPDRLRKMIERRQLIKQILNV